MRVGIVASQFLPIIGGAEIVVHQLAEALNRRGVSVDVITWWGRWRKMRNLVPYRILPLLPKSYTNRDRLALECCGKISNNIHVQLTILRKLRKYDVINYHYAWPLAVMDLLPSGQLNEDCPWVLTCHGWDILIDSALEWGARLKPNWHRLMCMLAKGNGVAVSQSFLLDEGFKEIGWKMNRCIRVPNGISLSYILSHRSKNNKLIEKYNISSNSIVVATIGRPVRAKGFNLICGICRCLLDMGVKDFVWIICGRGVMNWFLQINDIDVKKRIIPIDPSMHNALEARTCYKFPSPLILEIYRRADIYVHPAKLESFGNVVIEAMAMGLPIICSNRTGAAECVIENEAGVVLECFTETAWAYAVADLIDDQNKRLRMGRNGRHAAYKYDWEVVSNKYLSVYECAIAQ